MNRYTWLTISVIVVLLAACTAPPTPAPTPKVGAPYKIGFIASITGPGASLGVPERNVAQLVQERLKAQGGIVGPDGVRHEVQILIFDDESKTDTAASVARRLIEQEGVVLLVEVRLAR